ncbi:septin-1-like isoform X2, partial [Leptotrombidium deliense]
SLNATVKIVSNTIDIEERGVKLKLTVVDTPGFGDSLDSKDCTDPIISYIDEQFERYLQHESGLNRRQIVDTRVHCCFYFISPIGYGLKPIDIHFLKSLHKRVNIIPLIAKADSLTSQELNALKKRIMEEIVANGISIYSVPDCDGDEDEEYKEQIKQIKASV